ncbi:unnamed protein product [Urochloa humidicola]
MMRMGENGEEVAAASSPLLSSLLYVPATRWPHSRDPGGTGDGDPGGSAAGQPAASSGAPLCSSTPLLSPEHERLVLELLLARGGGRRRSTGGGTGTGGSGGARGRGSGGTSAQRGRHNGGGRRRSGGRGAERHVWGHGG